VLANDNRLKLRVFRPPLSGLRVSVVPRRECAMELLSEVESLCDSLFWDRANVGKRLASLRKLQTAVTCEGAPPPAILPPPTRI